MIDGGLLPTCVWPEEWKDVDGCIPLELFARALDNCRIDVSDAGLCFKTPFEIRDKHGHLLDGDHDPEGANGCDHRDTPEWLAEHAKEIRMSQETVTITQPPAPGPMTATVGVPDNALEQVKSLVPVGAQANGTTVLLALVGVAGGGAAFKLYQNMTKNNAEKSERAHELEMKRLDLEHQSKQSSEDQHKSCAVERAALEAKVAGLTAKLEEISAKTEKSSMSLSGLDPEDLEQRLVKIEKTLKPARRGRPPKER